MKLNKNTALKNIIGFFNDEKYFRFVFLGSLFFSTLCTAGFYFYVLACISMIWAAYLFCYKMIYKGYIKLVRYRGIIYSFLGTAALTCFLHWQDNLIPNLFIVCWIGACFFFFLSMSSIRSSRSCRKETESFMQFIVLASTVIMLIGLVLLAIFPKGFEWNGDSFCIHENRFVGIIYNANITAFYSVTAVICCIFLWGIKKSEGRLKLKNRIYYVFCILVNLLTLFLSDSNGSLLMLITYCCFLAFYVIYKDYKHGFVSFLLRAVSLGLACIAVASILLNARTVVQGQISNLLQISETDVKISSEVSSSDAKGHISEEKEKKSSATFKHENKNIDSGRFVIWRQSLELFEHFPIMGVGKANIELYGERYMGGLKYSDFHNGLITIIISYGLVGFNIFMILAITAAKTLLKDIFRYQKECRKDGWVPVMITAFCAAYCIYSMLEIALLVDLSYKVFIFWLIIGLGLSYTSKYERHAIIVRENMSKRNSAVHRFVCAHFYCKKA